jgi:hypothetical protein
MSNQRQILQGIIQYQTFFRNKPPPGIYEGNMSNSRVLRYKIPNDFPEARPAHQDGWTGMGWLVIKNIVKDGHIFYCPGQDSTYTWENDYKPNLKNIPGPGGRIHSTYAYRLASSWPAPSIPSYFISPQNNSTIDAKAESTFIWGNTGYPSGAPAWAPGVNIVPAQGALGGRMKGVHAITTDNFCSYEFQGEMIGKVQWPHIRPYSLVVGYSDGHCEVVQLLEKDYNYLDKIRSNGPADGYLTLYFRAFDDGNYQKIRTILNIQ